MYTAKNAFGLKYSHLRSTYIVLVDCMIFLLLFLGNMDVCANIFWTPGFSQKGSINSCLSVHVSVRPSETIVAIARLKF